ncbi:YwlC protein [Boletus coccyginus]|nr:YwlC protein [Boletus coccyginus]
MTAQNTVRLYRSVAREVAKASISPRTQRNKDVSANFRRLFERHVRSSEHEAFRRDVENIVTFVRSQREHKTLLERYNPLVDLTAEERIEATARRVLKCDPADISFDHNARPSIASEHTLAALRVASRHLHDLQPIAFPTETVYGLAALALNTEAVSRIFSTKGRPTDNPLIVHVSSQRMLRSLLPPNFTIPPSYQMLISAFWPGPLTLLFPTDATKIPSIITANRPTVAVRMPSHPVARALIAVSNAPLAAPSANSSGRPSPTRAEHVLRDLNGKVGLILDGGPCDVGLESTVLDGLHRDGNIRILRPGGVTVEQIEDVLRLAPFGHSTPRVLVHRRDFVDDAIEQAPTTPGMKYRHYSPAVPVTLLRAAPPYPPIGANSISTSTFLASLKSSSVANPPPKVGLLAPSESVLAKALLDDPSIQWHRYTLGSLSELTVIAQRLFDGLFTLEQEGVDLILIEEVPEENEGLAIMNRVKKAASETCWIVSDSLQISTYVVLLLAVYQ